MRNPVDQKATVINADLLLIMRNTGDHKTTATNADLLLIMRNPEDHNNNCNKCIFTFKLCETLNTKKQLPQL